MTYMAPSSIAGPDVRALVELGQASAMLAHELRNPLTALKGHAQLLLEGLPSSDRRRQGAARVVAEAERMERLVRDALDLVRPVPVNRERGDVGALCRSAALDPERVRVTGPEPLAWALDVGRVRQVLANLVANALEADDQAAVEIRYGLEGGLLLIEVLDDGPGVDPELLPRLFEPFVSGRSGGTGLGLAICHRLVELHGGTLTASNRYDGGACFALRLPGSD